MYFGNHYVHWREKRFQAIANHYPKNFFQGKTLLELGAGHGDLGAMFAGLGAEVTCAEGRPQHIRVGQNRYYNLNMKFVQVNLEYDWQERGPEHDGYLECGQRRMWFIERV